MKKGLLFIAALVLTNMTAFAQVDNTLRFVDAAGNVVEDGSTVTGILEHMSDPLNGEYDQISTGLSVKNTSGEKVGVSVAFNVTRIDNGSFICCYPSQCGEITTPTNSMTTANLVDGNSLKPFATEWVPTPGAYGTKCQATLTLQIYNVQQSVIVGIPVETVGTFKGNGPTITLDLTYNDPTGISGVTVNEDNGEATYFTIDGRKLNAPQKGLNIIRYANGKTIKKIIK